MGHYFAILVNYSYLADGTKLEAVDGSGAGLTYRSSLIYRRTSGGALSLESAAFSKGTLTTEGARYHVTDHLGSVRAVVDGETGDFLEAGKYDAYGSRSEQLSPGAGASGTGLRWHFTGKEDQGPDFGTAYTDFGARQYSPALRRWLVPDPLSEKYYDVSPYVYCNDNPVNMVDVDGRDWYASSDSLHYVWFNGNADISGYTYYGPQGSLLGEAEDMIDSFIKDRLAMKDGLFKDGFELTIASEKKSIFGENGFWNEFVNNSGPEFTILTASHPMTKELMKTSKVQEFEETLFAGKRDIVGGSDRWHLYDVITHRSIVRQFVGSYVYRGRISSSGTLVYNMIYDSKSRHSLFVHLPFVKNKSRAETAHFGNTYQFYIWADKKK